MGPVTCTQLSRTWGGALPGVEGEPLTHLPGGPTWSRPHGDEVEGRWPRGLGEDTVDMGVWGCSSGSLVRAWLSWTEHVQWGQGLSIPCPVAWDSPWVWVTPWHPA